MFDRISQIFTAVKQFNCRTALQRFSLSRKNKFFLYFMSYWFITIVFCPAIRRWACWYVENDPFFFFYVTGFGLLFNIWNSKKNKDFTFRTPFNFNWVRFDGFLALVNSFIFEIKKFFLFLKNVVLLKPLNIITEWFRFVSKKVVFWHPLFKKTSYYSFYKSFTSRFFK